MTSVIVTGADGQLGKSIQARIGSYDEINGVFLSKESLDITRVEEIRKRFKEHAPEYCINTAAFTEVDEAEVAEDKAMEVNACGAENLARACAEFRVILIHLSTDYVFDGSKPHGYRPTDKPNPINAYGRSKWEGEKRIGKCLDRYFIIRTSWLYSEYPPNFFTTILNRLNKNENLEVTDQQRGCPTKAGNLAKYILELITSDDQDFGIRHFTDGEPMTWYESALRIKNRYAPDSTSKIRRGNNYRSFAKRPECSILLP